MMRAPLIIWLVAVASPAAAEPVERTFYAATGVTLAGDDPALSLGGGARVDVGRHAIEVAGPAAGVTPDGDVYVHRYLGVAASTRPAARLPSLAVGAGLAYGTRIVVEMLDGDVPYQHRGAGLDIVAFVRYALRDAPAVFVQLDAQLPLHTIDTWGEESWVPAVTLSLGVSR